MSRLLSGNQAIAYAALKEGIALAAGYPGTPSTEALAEIERLAAEAASERAPFPYVEWSVNEKVAFELAAASAWAGQRALVTMKMSGANVALDALIGVAHSGVAGGLVVYVADDPGVEAGMPEQDSRLLAQLCGLPLLDPADPASAYRLTRYAFGLSEHTNLPVLLRSVTSVAHARGLVEGEFRFESLQRRAGFTRDLSRFTKAGSLICLAQHRENLARLARAEEAIASAAVNTLQLGSGRSRLAAIGAGVLNAYLAETLAEREAAGAPEVSALFLEAVLPLEQAKVAQLLRSASALVVFEELEPVVEREVRSLATCLGWRGRVLGKLDGVLPRVGRYTVREIQAGLSALEAAEPSAPGTAVRAAGVAPATGQPAATVSAASRPLSTEIEHPITFCAGCPHRGTYLALNRALKALKLPRDQVVVTGDIGCTILGINPPLSSCWTELAMGSSIALAQGFERAGLKGPLVAAIGDSTFFHAGIPPLVNAVQHGANLMLVILDNGWTSMTGFQVNPGTEQRFQSAGGRRVSLAAIVRAIGADLVAAVDPFDQEAAVEAVKKALQAEGVRVIIAERECALTAARRIPEHGTCRVDAAGCTFCRACLRETGCPALVMTKTGEKEHMSIDEELCTGCGLCATCCKFEAIHQAEA
jgi:indolepyruvate ferredoxin oxidoreductase alpha subunit